jgi:NAD(P)H dehydrogenase (quinone)
MLQFVGFDVLAPQIVYGPAHIQDGQRRLELERFGKRLAQIAEESPIEVGRY